jgi:PIN domain nuclease of toxin-antitoxin system
MLVDRGRLTLAEDVETWLTRVANIESLRFVPIDSDIAVASALLPGAFHKDPADRFIVATARKLAIPIVTADARIQAYRQVRSLW